MQTVYWVVGGSVAWTIIAMVPLLLLHASTQEDGRPTMRAYVTILASVLVGGLILGAVWSQQIHGAGWVLLAGPSFMGGLITTRMTITWIGSRQRNVVLEPLKRERSRTAADAAIALAQRSQFQGRNELARGLLEAGFAKDALTIWYATGATHETQRAVIQGNLALAHLSLGDIPAARTALARATFPAQPAFQAFRRAVDARIAAYDGRPDDALRLLANMPPGLRPGFQRDFDLTRAHALAAKNDRDGARALLHGRDDLRSIADGNGPAAALAAELLADAAQPFR
jgi:hypothetical protein